MTRAQKRRLKAERQRSRDVLAARARAAAASTDVTTGGASSGVAPRHDGAPWQQHTSTGYGDQAPRPVAAAAWLHNGGGGGACGMADSLTASTHMLVRDCVREARREAAAAAAAASALTVPEAAQAAQDTRVDVMDGADDSWTLVGSCVAAAGSSPAGCSSMLSDDTCSLHSGWELVDGAPPQA